MEGRVKEAVGLVKIREMLSRAPVSEIDTTRKDFCQLRGSSALCKPLESEAKKQDDGRVQNSASEKTKY